MGLRERTKEIASYSLSVGVREASKHYGLEQSSVRREVRKFKEYHKFNKFGKPREPKALLLDIETSTMLVHVWGLRQNSKYISTDSIEMDWIVLCWSGKWLCKGEHFGTVLTPQEATDRDDERILREIWSLLDEADVVIMHNGVSFDRKKLNARFKIHGMLPPSSYQVIDTCHQARHEFGFTSNQQGYLNKILKLPEKKATGYDLWLRCHRADPEALAEMMNYCQHDVGGLEELYLSLRPWMVSHPNMALYGEMNNKCCHRCGSEDIEWGLEYATPMNIYDEYRCKECGGLGRNPKTSLTKAERSTLTRSVAR